MVSVGRPCCEHRQPPWPLEMEGAAQSAPRVAHSPRRGAAPLCAKPVLCAEEKLGRRAPKGPSLSLTPPRVAGPVLGLEGTPVTPADQSRTLLGVFAPSPHSPALTSRPPSLCMVVLWPQSGAGS